MIQDNTDYLYEIKGLQISEKKDLSAVAEGIKEYIALIPELSKSLENNLRNDLKLPFIKDMNTILSLLRGICARWLEIDAEDILKSAERGHLAVCRKNTTPFIKDLLSLSIELQMFQENPDQTRDIMQRKMETYTDVVKNISAIGKLIARPDYPGALEMLADMKDIKNDAAASRLAEVLELEDKLVADELINDIRLRYINLIVQMGGAKPGDEKKILAVDDKPEILTAVANMLKGRYKVFGATGGADAIKISVKQKLDLFLLDIEMPGMDGFMLAKTLRSFDEYYDTPIIFLTSNASSQFVLKALQSGCNDFIVKPAGRDIILAKVDKYLR